MFLKPGCLPRERKACPPETASPTLSSPSALNQGLAFDFKSQSAAYRSLVACPSARPSLRSGSRAEPVTELSADCKLFLGGHDLVFADRTKPLIILVNRQPDGVVFQSFDSGFVGFN